MTQNIIKIALVILLAFCLFSMPYGYYQLVRFCSFVGFGILAYKSSKYENSQLAIVYGALSLLFQPFYKVNLSREIWNFVDIAVILLLGIPYMQKLFKS